MKLMYLYIGFTGMITLEYTYTVYKTLVNPVLGTHQPNQTGFFSYDVIAFISTIKGYIKSFFSLQVEQQHQKRKVNKIHNFHYELGAMTSRCQLPKLRHDCQKIELVINGSKAVSLFRIIILRVLSFRFLSA